ncbi:MAG: hypothetical protein V1835_02660 [Candidatus Micrarchaeota archaeon]
MIIEAVCGALLGAAGAVPFLHTNMLLQIFSGGFQGGTSSAIFAIALGISHSFFEIFPAAFVLGFGVKMGDDGGNDGSRAGIFNIALLSLAVSIAMLPVFCVLLPLAMERMQDYLKFVFLAIVVSQFFSDGWRPAILGAFVFVFSGILGSITFFGSVVAEPLFPMLSGFFAIPALLFGSQEEGKPGGEGGSTTIIVLMCVFASAFSTLFPAMTVGVLLGMMMLVLKGKGALGIAVPGLIVSKTFFDIAASAITGKTRSLAAVLATPLSQDFATLAVPLIASVAIFSGCIAMLMILNFRERIGKLYGEAFSEKYRRLILCAIVAGIFASGGANAIILSAAAAGIGITIHFLEIKRGHAMGALIVPSLLFMFGIDAQVSGMLFN